MIADTLLARQGVEAIERESMAGILSKWPGISMPANKYSPEGG